jgi:tryptophan synthase alpha chain
MGSSNRIDTLFHKLEKGKKVMNLFITAGYPDLDATVDLILGFEKNGADIIELGMPFSDPLADGPTIQRSSLKAIENGVSISVIFQMVAKLREQSQIPIVLMGYVNPVIQYGVDAFCAKAAEVGVDGLIIPDLILEEAALIEDAAIANDLDFIHLVAPNSSDERMKAIDQRSNGFVYCVSVTGVTGARTAEEVSSSVDKFIDRVNLHVTKNPKLIGFGIKSYEDARKVTKKADGFIVGSALIDTIDKYYPLENWQNEVFDFVHKLKNGE